MKILALTADPTALEALEQYCRDILGARLTQFTAATAATAHLQQRPGSFDVVLLDTADDGLDFLARHPDLAARTIVLAGDAALAVRAFELGAVDFLPHPTSRARLAKALLRIAPVAPADKLIAVRRYGRIDLVPVDDLAYVEGADKYSELVLANGQRSFHDQCLGRLEATLPRSFVRIHKSYLVRFPLVARLLVLRGSRYFAVLKNGQRLPVGRSRYAQIKSRLI